MHDSSADEDGAFERIFQFAAEAAGERGDETVLRKNELLTDMLQQEAACSVGVLGVAGREAELAEEGRLLIAGDARDGNGAQSQSRGHFADAIVGPDHLRHHAFRNV